MEATGLCVCWENTNQDTATEENRIVRDKDSLISITDHFWLMGISLCDIISGTGTPPYDACGSTLTLGHVTIPYLVTPTLSLTNFARYCHYVGDTTRRDSREGKRKGKVGSYGNPKYHMIQLPAGRSPSTAAALPTGGGTQKPGKRPL